MAPRPVKKVPVTPANADVCMCIKCPVQAKSKNANNISLKSEAARLKQRAFSGLYCSTGNCKFPDFDYKQICICGSCPVYIENHLSSGRPNIYYCRDGESK